MTTYSQVISNLHRRFPKIYDAPLIASFASSLAPPARAQPGALPSEQREKEDSARVGRQRPILRVSSELALVGIISDGPGKSGGEWIMKVLKDLVSPALVKMQHGVMKR